MVKKIEWPDKSAGCTIWSPTGAAKRDDGMDAEEQLQFPPINLWVIAASHRQQRPGFSAKRPNALNKLHRRLASLLAVRGGKQ